jgi:hypothetical protein
MDRLTRQAGHRDISGHRGHLSRHVPGHFGTETYRSVPKCPDGYLPWLGWKIAAQNKGFFNPARRRNGGKSEGAEKTALSVFHTSPPRAHLSPEKLMVVP